MDKGGGKLGCGGDMKGGSNHLSTEGAACPKSEVPLKEERLKSASRCSQERRSGSCCCTGLFGRRERAKCFGGSLKLHQEKPSVKKTP